MNKLIINGSNRNKRQRQPGTPFTPEVIKRCILLYKNYTLVGVFWMISQEFPNKRFSLERIRRLILNAKLFYNNKIRQLMAEGRIGEANKVQLFIDNNLMDKRRRNKSKSSMKMFVDSSIKDLLGVL